MDERCRTGSDRAPPALRSARRVDHRRVISLQMLRSGAQWRDCPEVYGSQTTAYNRFTRWSRQGVWTGIFEAPTGQTGSTGRRRRSRSTRPTCRRTARRPAQEGSLRARDRPLPEAAPEGNYEHSGRRSVARP
ncbi:transposase [Jannaschia seohaensis]|uniref:transposase n=1 Tax=Jannaschia seohaensis TaxID=475081 RepID=UPI00387EBC71